MRSGLRHSYKRSRSSVKFWPRMEPLAEDATQVFDQSHTEQLLEELSSLCYVHQHQIVLSDSAVKIAGLDHLILDILLALQDCGALPPNLLGACSIKAMPVTRPAQDGLWRCNSCTSGGGLHGSSSRDARSVLEYTLTLPRGALPVLVAALRRDADTDHPQCITASGFEVDFRLRGLIQLLNDHGFTTSNSCEDNHGHLWVEFTDLQVYADLMEVCYRQDKAWTSRFLAAEDRCKTTVTWSVDAYYDESRKCEDPEITRDRPGRLTNGHASIRVPLQYFQEFTIGIFNILEAAGKPARAGVSHLTPFVAPEVDSRDENCVGCGCGREAGAVAEGTEPGGAEAAAAEEAAEAEAGPRSSLDVFVQGGADAADGAAAGAAKRDAQPLHNAGSLKGWLAES